MVDYQIIFSSNSFYSFVCRAKTSIGRNQKLQNHKVSNRTRLRLIGNKFFLCFFLCALAGNKFLKPKKFPAKAQSSQR